MSQKHTNKWINYHSNQQPCKYFYNLSKFSALFTDISEKLMEIGAIPAGAQFHWLVRFGYFVHSSATYGSVTDRVWGGVKVR